MQNMWCNCHHTSTSFFSGLFKRLSESFAKRQQHQCAVASLFEICSVTLLDSVYLLSDAMQTIMLALQVLQLLD